MGIILDSPVELKIPEDATFGTILMASTVERTRHSALSFFSLNQGHHQSDPYSFDSLKSRGCTASSDCIITAKKVYQQ